MPKYQLITMFDSEEEMRAFVGGETRTDTAPAPVVTNTSNISNTPEERNDLAQEDVITADVDKDDMPYDSAIHADPKSFTAKGLWRSARGKSEEANEARAAFKAGGGAVETPSTAATGGMPTGGMPGAAAKAPEPITYEELIDKTMDSMSRGMVDNDGVLALYTELGIQDDPSVLETNETMRAKLAAKLTALDEA